jgi:hypothetical protein
MQRRDFLGSAVTGGAITAGVGLPLWLTGCGAAAPRPELGARETTELLRRLDGGLAMVDETPPGFLADARPWQLRPDLTEPLLRIGAQALVVADVARSIPENTPVPAELRGRLVETLPILDRCTASYHRLLATTPPAVRRNVDRHFRAQPDAAMDVASWLDERAVSIGISSDSRRRLRSNASWVTTRIRRQSTTALVDDTLLKVERAVARSGGSLDALRAATTGGFADAIWAAVDGEGTVATPPPPSGYGGTTTSGTVIVTPSTAASPYAAPAEPPATESPGDSELMVGGILIGCGLAAFGIATLIGWAAGSAAWGAIIGATPGGALVITGIIVMIVGAVQNANG